MQVEVLVDFHHLDILTEKHVKTVSSDGQITVILNLAAGGQILAYAGGISILSTDSLPKGQIHQAFNYEGRKHFLDIIPTP